MKGGHVSRWPPGWRSDRRRVPAILVNDDGDWQIVDPDGRTFAVASHAEVLAVAAHPYPEETIKPRHLDVFVGRLPWYPWLAEAMQDEGTTAYPRGNQRIGGLICPYGRLKLRIEEAAAWGAEDASQSFMQDITRLYAMLGVGAYPTPGGLGMSVMETEYLAAGHARQSRPSVALRSALLDGRIGGRNDWTDSAETFDRVWECDQRNAYLSASALPLPTGGVVRFLDGEVRIERENIADETGSSRPPQLSRQDMDNRQHWDHPGDGTRRPDGEETNNIHQSQYRTWFGYCTVVNSRRLRNSPILERSTAGRLTPFTRVGSLLCWLWKEEAEEAVKAGSTVGVLEGWGWRTMEPVLRPWAEKMHNTRLDAAKVSPDLERMVKLCIVAAIGRHGCRPERRSVIPLSQAKDGDAVLTDCLDGQWASHTESEIDAPWNTVWHSYIEMQIRLSNYRLQVEEVERANVVLASNVDAVYLLYPPAVAHQPDVLGGWRVRDKHHVRFPFARGLVSDEKVSLPGIPTGSAKRKEMVRT